MWERARRPVLDIGWHHDPAQCMIDEPAEKEPAEPELQLS